MTVDALPPWAAADEACRLLATLRAVPEIMDEIAASHDSEMALQSRLRGRYDDAVVRAALTLHDARRRAAGKFARAREMWFDRVGAEQATAELVARHKAQRFSGQVWDLCCGIGGDALALAARGAVMAVDQSPATLLRARYNGEVYAVAEQLTCRCADVTTMLPEVAGLIHIDPDRRPGSGGRVSRVEDYVPGLSFVHELMSHVEGGAIKVGPASNFGGKFPGVETELVSLNGECKEATLWFGSLAGSAPFRATALPSGETLAGHPLDVVAEQSELGQYLFDPDPSVVRAGLVDLLADRLRLRRLDAAEEYLTGDAPLVSPFVQTFAVLDELPNNERELRQAVRQREFGALEIKCRHLRIDADALRRRLPNDGDRPGVVVFARIAGKSRIVIAERVRHSV